MEKLLGPIINPVIFGGEENGNGEELEKWAMEDNMPFLQMLQSVETPSLVTESNSTLRFLLKLQQHQKKRQRPPSVAETEISAPVNNKRKRKKTRPVKNREEMENHRMTHIAVERNRRRQMNDHLTQLRSLMPSSYVQRGDQASIIGGAIDFIKELEQLLQSLQVQKRCIKTTSSEAFCENSNSCSSSSCSSSTQYEKRTEEGGSIGGGGGGGGGGVLNRAERRSMVAQVEVTLIHNHANLRIHCGNRGGQLFKLVVALEDLRLTVLHLNVTSFETSSSIFYTFSLKMEEDCKLRTAMEIAETIDQIFRLINGYC